MEDLNTKVLLHCDGTEGSTTITDSAKLPHTWTSHGATITTADKKFGTGCISFNGSTWVDTPSSADFNFSSGDFTIDFWIKRNRKDIGQEFIFGQVDSASSTISPIQMLFTGENRIRTVISDSVGNGKTLESGSITDTNWHHVALIRYSSTLTLYLNGVSVATQNTTGFTLTSSIYKMAIGRLGERTDSCFSGKIDEFRIVNGVAKWTTNFAPPTQPYSYGWPGKIYGISPKKIFGLEPKKVMGI